MISSCWLSDIFKPFQENNEINNNDGVSRKPAQLLNHDIYALSILDG